VIGRTIAHYAIVEKLGEGGMGVVYKARDTHLDRFVALKVLPPEKVADAERKRRFVREAKAASALNHPNIITIHDIDQESGTDFMAMEYVPGQTLSRLIARGLAPKDAVKYAIQITDALVAAQAAGIIHRDLKPANVMVTEAGLVKVLDFGLAKLTEWGESEATRTLTAEGMVVGTCAYMAPEQAEGRAVDARSDLFSFGAVLYEMLSGRRAFAGPSNLATLTAVLHNEPAPLGGGAPAELERIVMRCLRKNPEEQYASACEVKQALEEAALTPASLPSIAVLPFANLSADKENEYFSDGLAEDIIDALTRLPGLRVIARTSAFAFRGKDVDVSEIGAKLKVATILEGSVRKAGSRIRVTAQLIKAADQSHLWSERYDREMTDVFAIQDQISQAIVEKLRVRLEGDRPLVKRQTENLEAYNLFLRGRHCILRGTQESLAKGKEYLEQAIALDPDYALAYAGMAEFYWMSAFWGLRDPKQFLPKAKSAAVEAASRDDTLAEVHALSGVVRGTVDFDWVGAEQEFRRALELSPASPIIRYKYGFFFLRPMGRLDEALSELRRAVELDPLSATYNICLAYLYYAREQYDLAIAQQRRAMDLDPGWYMPHWLLAIQYGNMGMFEEAIASGQKASELSGRNAPAVGILAWAYGLAGRPSEARALLEQLTTLRRTTYVPPFAMVAVFRGLGEVDQALEWLEKGVEERDLLVVTALRSEPTYKTSFRGHPRYQALLRKMNLDD
jgi:eukaryotic-like serine/threonine-protein kinase